MRGGDDPAAVHLFIPALDRFPASLREIVGLLPVTDINGGLLAALSESGRRDDAGQVVAGIFAADPFLDLVELGDRLRQAGIVRVANYPTLQHFEGATAEGLTAVGYDLKAEFAVLTKMRASGFAPFAYVASLQAAERAIADRLSTLVFHSSPPPVAPSERTAQAKIAALARKAGARLLLHASPSTNEAGEPQPISP